MSVCGGVTDKADHLLNAEIISDCLSRYTMYDRGTVEIFSRSQGLSTERSYENSIQTYTLEAYNASPLEIQELSSYTDMEYNCSEFFSTNPEKFQFG